MGKKMMKQENKHPTLPLYHHTPTLTQPTGQTNSGPCQAAGPTHTGMAPGAAAARIPGAAAAVAGAPPVAAGPEARPGTVPWWQPWLRREAGAEGSADRGGVPTRWRQGQEPPRRGSRGRKMSPRRRRGCWPGRCRCWHCPCLLPALPSCWPAWCGASPRRPASRQKPSVLFMSHSG